MADGGLLTELPVILQYVGSLVPEAELLPASTMTRLRAHEWLNFTATEIHKSFSPLFRSTTPGVFLKPGREHLCRRLDVVERHLRQDKFLLGDRFSLADVYLFVVLRWLGDHDLSIAAWPELQRHFDEILNRSAVKIALAHEGLAK